MLLDRPREPASALVVAGEFGLPRRRSTSPRIARPRTPRPCSLRSGWPGSTAQPSVTRNQARAVNAGPLAGVVRFRTERQVGVSVEAWVTLLT
jgi:hypothetical protein